MKNILEEILSTKVKDLKKQRVHGQKILNMIKGDPLHLIVLNYLYSHKTYKNFVMYGGSALKIVYGLPRMSVDLDFQMDFSFDPESFKKDITHYFKNKYGYEKLGILAGTEGKDTTVIKITFSDLDKFRIPDVGFTKLKVRLDLNQFEKGAFQHILIPKSGEYHHFNLRTYPLSTLMASKIAAVLNRVQYGVPAGDGRSILADYKGRDIFDLIWYMQKGIIPHLGYLEKKGHVYRDYPSLFKKIKERVNNLSDGGKALGEDLSHLYLDPDELDEWMREWNGFFLEGLQNYSAHKVAKLEKVSVRQVFDNDHFIFKYSFETEQQRTAVFQIEISDLYIEDFPVHGFKRDDMNPLIESKIKKEKMETATEYAGLFYSKIEAFLKRIHHVSPKLNLRTKFIQFGYGGFEPETTLVLTKKELETCQFEDLL